ncbi:glycerol kinase [Solirubrobacter sp. CPCC 204708]|uniref:ATP:glycerol 3-phosphotransferase n=1 Tax=Solirubrobacter deserti TaxID=2282478 RepID=A0ABT4RK40_9ACTN|nr:FGGY family carbohydrate kinase [Solirubrobacter deserti]MBE2315841.1 glycerol kinase [Solirubrobacter deserti]MDA0138823.1 FGGY family carbohydrate kinase [Solirubrobacter deserti]
MTVLAIDQGTSSTKGVLVGDDGAVLARASVPVKCCYPHPGWVEQDAEEIWQSVLAVIDQLPAPDAIALSNQRESAVVWDDTSVSPVIGWQDARTAPDCDRLREHEPFVRARTGLALDPMFSATKLHRLLGGRDDRRAGTIDAFLVHRLTGEFATEAGNASRTLLLNLETLEWDPELCELFGVPLHTLPEIRRSDAGFGSHRGVPVAAVLADSHAALYAHGAAKATYGTGSSVMVPSDSAVDGLAHTLAWRTDSAVYAVEGNILASAAALDWMARTLGVEHLEPLARQAPTTDGVHLVPAFGGLGAPHWDRDASGVIAGLTLGTTPAQLARAAFESVAHQICDIVDRVELDALHADGGATASELLMQLQADLAGVPVHVSTSPEMSALGVADLAAGGRRERPTRTFVPAISDDERHARREAWHAAVRRSRMASPELEGSLR